MADSSGQLYQTLTQALRIDKHALDRELIDLPHLFHSVCEAHTMAISRRDRVRDDRERIRAKAYGRIRFKLEKAGVKITEALINNEMVLDPEVQTAEKSVRDATETAGLWESLEKAWSSRSYALKDLVVLHVKAYDQSNSSTVGSVAQAREAGARDNAEIKKKTYKPLQDRKPGAPPRERF